LRRLPYICSIISGARSPADRRQNFRNLIPKDHHLLHHDKLAMNFVRFVKTPRIDVPNKNKKASTKKSATKQLSMILTITTDFSPFAGSAELLCQLVSTKNQTLSEKLVTWHEYNRELKVELKIPTNFKEGKVIVAPTTSNNGRRMEGQFLLTFLGRETSNVVGVETDAFTMDTPARQDVVYRTFSVRNCPLRIAEQSGETIIRHVWDAGVILSAALAFDRISELPDELQIVISGVVCTTKETRILELGCGVGVLGISIASAFPHCQVIMTDLSDAQVLVEENIRLNLHKFPHLGQNTRFRVLNWEAKPYPAWTVKEKFDVIVMADVTYNTATFTALADTLEHLLRTRSKGGKVLCCGKRRHDEEEGFWRLVQERGFIIEKRIIFGMDLDGNFRRCPDGVKTDGEQLIDFIIVHL
jgi:2-polyprenyl-3-methyl-5-hydroxy-6-metoxy-1,4-benzoquinol methylase